MSSTLHDSPVRNYGHQPHAAVRARAKCLRTSMTPCRSTAQPNWLRPPCTLEVAADAATGYQRSMYDFAAARTLPTFESTRSQVGLSYAR